MCFGIHYRQMETLIWGGMGNYVPPGKANCKGGIQTEPNQRRFWVLGFESRSDLQVFGPGLAASSGSGSFSAKLPHVIKIGIVEFLYVDNIVHTSIFLCVCPLYLYLSLGLPVVSGPIWYRLHTGWRVQVLDPPRDPKDPTGLLAVAGKWITSLVSLLGPT